MYSNIPVFCQWCQGSYFLTTTHYTPDRPSNGAMFALKKEYREAGWSSFPEHDGMMYGDLECPQCNGPLCESDGVVVVDIPQGVQDDGREPCPVCGKRFAKRGLQKHISVKHPEYKA